MHSTKRTALDEIIKLREELRSTKASEDTITKWYCEMVTKYLSCSKTNEKLAYELNAAIKENQNTEERRVQAVEDLEAALRHCSKLDSVIATQVKNISAVSIAFDELDTAFNNYISTRKNRRGPKAINKSSVDMDNCLSTLETNIGILTAGIDFNDYLKAEDIELTVAEIDSIPVEPIVEAQLQS